MNFFQHQDKAKHRTVTLVVFYIFALLLLAAAFYGIIIAVLAYAIPDYRETVSRNFFFEPGLFLAVFGTLIPVVSLASLYKTYCLSVGGGKAIAESLGGRLISPGSGNPAEQRLYNVVEEMAIASGIPIPPVYIMDNEPGINAFAAGLSPNEAVISVNRGTVELLTRDELQGVVAHEFSHILNGDMRLNLRMIGVLFGLQILTVVGYYGFRIASQFGGSRRSNSKDNSGAVVLAVILVSLLIMILGGIGMFLSAIVRAAISRQREFLADASAVQFTRNPNGIADALKKIGCPKIGSAVRAPQAAEASHLFFSNISRFSLGALFATHPDLTTRIRRLDPAFDGKFPKEITRVNLFDESLSPQQRRTPRPTIIPTPQRAATPANVAGLSPVLSSQTAAASQTIQQNVLQTTLPQIGQPNAEQIAGRIAVASSLLENIPQEVTDNIREPLSAKAAFYAVLLMESDDNLRNRQLAYLTGAENDYVVKVTRWVYGRIVFLSPQSLLPFTQRLTAILRSLSPPQYKHFSEVVKTLVHADNKVSLLEYTITALLQRDLDVYFGFSKPLSVKYNSAESVREPIAVVLSILARYGHDTETAARSAFSAAAKELPLNNLEMTPAEDSALPSPHESLTILSQTSPKLKRQLFTAMTTCVQHDGQITVKEGELLRANAAMLGLPMPMF
ncbi:MAG: M48 family metallopeptidase [Planctomycetaceae bacterium]|jgi:Zn-dependent protease with chaperone function|nr:M48 family metallopeptidase [Planctomycetaceae bacterium]